MRDSRLFQKFTFDLVKKIIEIVPHYRVVCLQGGSNWNEGRWCALYRIKHVCLVLPFHVIEKMVEVSGVGGGGGGGEEKERVLLFCDTFNHEGEEVGRCVNF